jgi:N-acetylmuramoyl-L-alanine amidase
LKIFVILFALIFPDSGWLRAGELVHVEVKARSGDAVSLLFSKYKLNASDCNISYFKEINHLPDNLSLISERIYKLPVIILTYNRISIRTTIGNDDLELAKKIQAYNEDMLKSGLRGSDYRSDNILWIPYEYLFCGKNTVNSHATSTLIIPILGEAYKNITISDNKLKGNVYYIVAGHGGPDPGAMGKYNSYTLCEDEYAYDVALRLTRNLLEHGATVYVITRDKYDGIRDNAILAPDKDEVFYKNRKIPLDQVDRLNLACSVINELYEQNKNAGIKKQVAVNLHLDSRTSGQRVDMFFYHKSGSDEGEKLALILKNTVEEKYNHYQKNRGYEGEVKSRNLHMLRKTVPVTVFIELGNIRNGADQKRFVLKDNRQAVANWLSEGLMKY